MEINLPGGQKGYTKLRYLEGTGSENLQWLSHKGHDYLYINFQYCTTEERIAISNEVTPMIRERPPQSIRMVADVRNTEVTIESMRAVKDDWLQNYGHLKKGAIVGVTGVNSMLYKLWVYLSGSKVKAYRTLEEGREYVCS